MLTHRTETSRTDLLQGHGQWGGIRCGHGIVLDANANATYNLRTQHHDAGTYCRCTAVRRSLAHGTNTGKGDGTTRTRVAETGHNTSIH